MFGIEGVEIYFPKTYVDQAEYGSESLTKRNIKGRVQESTPMDWDSSNYPLLINGKMSTPSALPVPPQ